MQITPETQHIDIHEVFWSHKHDINSIHWYAEQRFFHKELEVEWEMQYKQW